MRFDIRMSNLATNSVSTNQSEWWNRTFCYWRNKTFLCPILPLKDTVRVLKLIKLIWYVLNSFLSEACAILLPLIIAHHYNFQFNLEIRTDCLQDWIWNRNLKHGCSSMVHQRSMETRVRVMSVSAIFWKSYVRVRDSKFCVVHVRVHVRGFAICDVHVRGYRWTSMSADTSVRVHRFLWSIDYGVESIWVREKNKKAWNCFFRWLHYDRNKKIHRNESQPRPIYYDYFCTSRFGKRKSTSRCVR